MFNYKNNKVNRGLNLRISWGPFQSKLLYDSEILLKWWMERKELIDHKSVKPVTQVVKSTYFECESHLQRLMITPVLYGLMVGGF